MLKQIIRQPETALSRFIKAFHNWEHKTVLEDSSMKDCTYSIPFRILKLHWPLGDHKEAAGLKLRPISMLP
jgi:hypothetical protein